MSKKTRQEELNKNRMVCLQCQIKVAPALTVDDLFKMRRYVQAQLRQKVLQSFTEWLNNTNEIFMLERGVADVYSVSVFVGDSKAVYESVFNDILRQLEEKKGNKNGQQQDEGRDHEQRGQCNDREDDGHETPEMPVEERGLSAPGEQSRSEAQTFVGEDTLRMLRGRRAEGES